MASLFGDRTSLAGAGGLAVRSSLCIDPEQLVERPTKKLPFATIDELQDEEDDDDDGGKVGAITAQRSHTPESLHPPSFSLEAFLPPAADKKSPEFASEDRVSPVQEPMEPPDTDEQPDPGTEDGNPQNSSSTNTPRFGEFQLPKNVAAAYRPPPACKSPAVVKVARKSPSLAMKSPAPVPKWKPAPQQKGKSLTSSPSEKMPPVKLAARSPPRRAPVTPIDLSSIIAPSPAKLQDTHRKQKFANMPTTGIRGNGYRPPPITEKTVSSPVESVADEVEEGFDTARSTDENALVQFAQMVGLGDLPPRILESEKKLAETTVETSSAPWAVDLEQISKTDMLAEISGSLAYLSTWELNEERCQKYAEKLKAGLERIDFDAMLERLNHWIEIFAERALDGDRLATANHVEQVFAAKYDVSETVARVTWKESFSTQLAVDLIRLTNSHVTMVRDALLGSNAALDDHEKRLEDLTSRLEEERMKSKTRSDLINRWQETLKYYQEVRGEAYHRHNLIEDQVKGWQREIQIMLSKSDEAQAEWTTRCSKFGRIRSLIEALNRVKLQSDVSSFWNPVDLVVEAQPQKLKFVCHAGNLKFTNPFLLVNHFHTIDNNARAKNEQTAAMREVALSLAVERSKFSSLLFSATPDIALTVQLPASPAVGPKAVNLTIGDTQFLDMLPTKMKSSMQLVPRTSYIILTLMSAFRPVVLQMITKNIELARNQGRYNVEAMAGITYMALKNCIHLVDELVRLDSDYEAFNASDVVKINEPIDLECDSLHFKIFVTNNQGAHRLALWIPVPSPNRVQIVLTLVNLEKALHSASLLAGVDVLSLKGSFDREETMITREVLAGADLEAFKREVAKKAAQQPDEFGLKIGLQRSIPFLLQGASQIRGEVA